MIAPDPTPEALPATLARSPGGWWRLAQAWPALRRLAALRNDPKQNFQSSRYWSTASHFYGLAGELVYALESGRPLDLTLRIQGDAGVDFRLADGRTVNVKCVTTWQDPHLKWTPGVEHPADVYALVALRELDRSARLVGWATHADLAAAETQDYGQGPRPRLLPHQLTPGLPPGA